MTQILDITSAVHHRMIPVAERTHTLAGGVRSLRKSPQASDRIGSRLYRSVLEEVRFRNRVSGAAGLVVFECERWLYVLGIEAERYLDRLPDERAEPIYQRLKIASPHECLILHFCQTSFSVALARSGFPLTWIEWGSENETCGN